jgi:hypothetical protein
MLGPARLNSVPKVMKPVYEKIVGLTDDVCGRHLNTAELCAAFEVGESTVHAKAREIEKTLGTQPLDARWTLPSLAEKNPLVWMAEVNGLVVDLRDMPREVQEIAFEDGLIPYIPADRKD